MSHDVPKLLIIDDQPESIGLLLDFLGSQHFDIAVALGGEDGLARARLMRPDLILLDVVMPLLDGFEVCRRLKADPATAAIPVVFLTGSTDVAEKLQGFEVGGVDYITKPFAAEEVLARIHVHFQSQKRIARLETMLARQTMEQHGTEEDREQQLFTAALAMLESNIAEPPGLLDLAHAIGTNERKLTEIFRQRVGLTVFEYLTELRMELARALLDKGDLQVRLIAEKVGYRNPGDFTRAFRNRYKVTPREYRVARRGIDLPGDA